MATYAIIAPSDSKELETQIEREFSGKFYKIAPGQFLVSSKLATDQMSKHIALSDGKAGRAIVIRIANYSGWHTKDMWEWLASPPGDEESSPEASPET